MQFSELIKRLQSGLNEAGEKLVVDGDPGPRTLAALEKHNAELDVKKKILAPTDSINKADFFGAPWIGANIDLLGRHETDPLLNERYVPEWRLEGLPHYKTLSGNTYAWCSLRMNADRRKVGVKGTDSAAAVSYARWGKPSPFWFGAALPIKHKNGKRHVCDFLYWIDESKRICATLDGNRGNRFCVALTDISGSGDIVEPSPRWSTQVADGKVVSMHEVLQKYPFLKVGGVGGSTR